jgi:hypothetical protein
LLLSFAILEPETTHVHGFGAALLDGAVGDANSGTVIAGSVGGGGWGWPISSRAVQMGTAFWLLQNMPPVLASAVEATTTLRIVLLVCTAPAFGESGGSVARG